MYVICYFRGSISKLVPSPDASYLVDVMKFVVYAATEAYGEFKALLFQKKLK